MLDSDGPPVHAIQPKPTVHTIMFGILLQKDAWV